MTSTRRKLFALALAGVYALFACAGQGLHSLAHRLGPSGGGETATCGCGDAGCIFAQREALHQQGASPTEASFAGPKAPGHDPHACGICQLLAQLKTAHGGDAETPRLADKAIETIGEAPPLVLTQTTREYDARGPPSAS